MRRTENVLHVGAHISIPMEDGTYRRCEVTKITDDGFQVKFYDLEGKGPFFCILPHAVLPGNTIHRNLHEDDRGGQHVSWWNSHPDVTGRTGEV